MILLASCCIAAAAWSAPAFASPHPGWVAVANDGRSPIEVDARRVAREHGRVALQVRARAPLDAVAAEFEDAGVDAATLERLRAEYDHSEHRWSFDCTEGTHALLHSAYHGRTRQAIREFVVDEPRWWPVRAQSVGGTLMRIACAASRRHAAEDPARPWLAPSPPVRLSVDADGDGAGDGDPAGAEGAAH